MVRCGDLWPVLTTNQLTIQTMRTLKFECQSLASEPKRPPLWVMVPLLHGLLLAIQTRILFQSKESNHAADHAYFGWNLSYFTIYDRFKVPKCHQALTQKCLTMQNAVCTKVKVKAESSF